MDNLEKQLSRLPKARLGIKADASLRFKLHTAIWQDTLADFRVWLSPSPRFSAAVLILIFLITSMAVPVYAYESSLVTSEHFLFPVKRAVEKIELGLSISPKSKAETLVKISNHRLDEAVVLSKEKNNEALQKSLNEAIVSNQKAQEELLNAKKELSVKIDEIIGGAKEEQIKKLENVAENIGAEAEDEIIENVAVTMDFVKGYDKKNKEKSQNEGNNVNKVYEQEDKSEYDNKLDAALLDEKQENLSDNSRDGKDNKDNIEQKKLYKKASPPKPDKKELENSLEEMKKEVEALKNDLGKEELEEKDVKSIVEKLDGRVEKVKKLLEEEELDEADTVLKSTQSIKNNAKSFIKTKERLNDFQKEDRTKNEDEDSDN